MKLRNLQRALLAAALSTAALQAFAVDLGTDAGLQVENRATVTFEVGSVTQTVDVHGDADFVVDRKVDLVVTKLADASVSPNQDAAVLKFSVQNKTNDTLDILLDHAAGATADFAPGSIQIFVDSTSGTVGTYVEGEDTATSIDDLDEDETATVFIVADIPGTASDTDAADLWLTAQAADKDSGVALVESASEDDPAVVENVFADVDADPDTGDNIDGEGDGFHAAMATYTVSTTTLTVAKRYQVIFEHLDSDGAGTDTDRNYTADADHAKPIPGALVQYCIQVTNGGGADAGNVSIEDLLGAVTPNTVGLYATYQAGSIRTGSSCGTDHATAVSKYDAATPQDDDDDDTNDGATTGNDTVTGTGWGAAANYDSGTGKIKSVVETLSSGGGTTATFFRVILK